MALTISNLNDRVEDVFGRNPVITAKKIQFDSSYPTGGESFTPADVGMSEFIFVYPEILSTLQGQGVVIQYDYVNQKMLLLYEEAVAAGGPLAEVADTTDRSLTHARVFIVGVR